MQLLGTSIWTYKGKDIMAGIATAVSPRAPQKDAALLAPAPPWHSVWLPIVMLYTPVHFLCAWVAVTFAILPAEYAAALWVGGLTIYYSLTCANKPEHSGMPSVQLRGRTEGVRIT